MTVRRCSVEAYPSHWIPSVSVWTCDGCGTDVAVKGWPDDPPDGWLRSGSVEDVRTGVQQHCCSLACAEHLNGIWTRGAFTWGPWFTLTRKQIEGEPVTMTGTVSIDQPVPAEAVFEKIKRQLKGHRPECTEHWCYCYDQDDPDPMCDCGEAALGCRCDELAANDPWREEDEP